MNGSALQRLILLFAVSLPHCSVYVPAGELFGRFSAVLTYFPTPVSARLFAAGKSEFSAPQTNVTTYLNLLEVTSR